MQPCLAPTPDLAALLRISALFSREPASSRAMARNEAGRGRAKAHGAARSVDGRAGSARARACCETVISCYPGNGLAPAPRADCGTEATEHTKQAAGAILGGTHPPARTTRARLREADISLGPGSSPGTIKENAVPGLDPGPRAAGRDIACLPDPHSRRDQNTRRWAGSRCRSLHHSLPPARSGGAGDKRPSCSLRCARCPFAGGRALGPASRVAVWAVGIRRLIPYRPSPCSEPLS